MNDTRRLVAYYCFACQQVAVMVDPEETEEVSFCPYCGEQKLGSGLDIND